ncbi:hypothetical protein, partial [Bartonella sp. CL2QHWL]|uniref:hypothetical protein n=1 Tax=Bartonella sp. CL2QHWL TaxID=3243523 RepID=UPI0035D06697
PLPSRAKVNFLLLSSGASNIAALKVSLRVSINCAVLNGSEDSSMTDSSVTLLLSSSFIETSSSTGTTRL